MFVVPVLVARPVGAGPRWDSVGETGGVPKIFRDVSGDRLSPSVGVVVDHTLLHRRQRICGSSGK